MVGWHHRLNGYEFEQTLGNSRQGALACCSPWGCQESDTTERLSNNSNNNKATAFFLLTFYTLSPLYQLKVLFLEKTDKNIILITTLHKKLKKKKHIFLLYESKLQTFIIHQIIFFHLCFLELSSLLIFLFGIIKLFTSFKGLFLVFS